jgi:outer membrane protein assembly factor BamB
MPDKRWYQTTAFLAVCCLVLPPLGIILLWSRRGTGIFRKLALSMALLALFAGHLFWFYGLHLEMDGTGMRPIFSFRDPSRHEERLAERTERTEVTASVPVAEPILPPEQGVGPASTELDRAEGSAAPADAYWSDFRGPGRAGRYDQAAIRTDWPSGGLPELWRQTVGGGYASVTIANGRVFTIEQRRNDEVVAAYDFSTGQELWSHRWPARFEEAMGGPGPRATPVWHEGRVYALGATGELHVLEDATGRLIWKKNILQENSAGNLQWAMAASPLIVDDKVIVLPGGSSGNSVVAYHKVTGEPVWRALGDKQAYTSPIEATLAGRRQILVVSGKRMMGLAVEDGALLWELPWTTMNDINVAQPLIVDENHVFLSAGYGQGSVLVKISGEGGSFQAEQVWKNTNMKCKFNSPVLYEGHVYGLDDGILASVDVRSGKRNWKGGRYGFGQLLLASGHLIVLTETGEVVLVKATPEGHQELARFGALTGKTWNNPAIADGKLIVRNQTEMACYELAVTGG